MLMLHIHVAWQASPDYSCKYCTLCFVEIIQICVHSYIENGSFRPASPPHHPPSTSYVEIEFPPMWVDGFCLEEHFAKSPLRPCYASNLKCPGARYQHIQSLCTLSIFLRAAVDLRTDKHRSSMYQIPQPSKMGEIFSSGKLGRLLLSPGRKNLIE